MNAAADAAAKRRSRKSERSSIGERPWRSMSTKIGRSTTAAAKPPMTSALFHPDRPPFESASTSPVSPTTNVDVPSEVEPALGVPAGDLVQDEVRPRGAEQAERDVEPEHPRPVDRDERAAEHRADDEADRGDHRVRAHREPELLLRERVRDERGRVREEERAADALEDAPEDEGRAAAGEAGAERRAREDEEAEHVRVLAAEEIREPSRRQHEDGRDDHVDEDHPDELQQRRVQAALEVGQRDDEGARVDGREQHPQARAGEHPPLEVLTVSATPKKTHSYVNVRLATGRSRGALASSRRVVVPADRAGGRSGCSS